MLPLVPLLSLLVTAAPDASGRFPAVLEAEPSELMGWLTADTDKLAARLTRGEEAAYTEAFRALEGKDLAKAREAAAALASVDTVDGWRNLRRRCAVWEKAQGRKNVFPQERGCGLSVYTAALQAVSLRTGLSQEEVVLDVARRLEAGEEGDLYAFARLTPPVWKKLVPLVNQARAEAVTNKGLRAFITRVDSDVVSSEPGSYQQEASRLAEFHKSNNRVALLGYSRNPETLYMLRLLAAYHLARLGDVSAMHLFEDPEFIDSGDAHIARVSLEELVNETQGPVRERVAGILELYSGAHHPAKDLELDATKRRKR
jgi:hypothetical protein